MTEKSNAKLVKITLTRSLIGRPEKQRKVARALGLKKSNDSVVRPETATIMGMVKKISHLLTVEVA